MATDNEMSKARKRAKMMYIFFVVVVIMFTIGTYVIFQPFDGDELTSYFDDPYITTMIIAMGAFDLAVFIGLFLFLGQTLRIINKIYKKKADALYKAAELRGGLFMSAAFFGVILGVFGAGAGITVLFFVAAVALLVFTFPTEERWQKMQELINGSSEPE